MDFLVHLGSWRLRGGSAVGSRDGACHREAARGARLRLRRGASKDWIELFIRNEKILSPDSEISRNYVETSQFFLQFF